MSDERERKEPITVHLEPGHVARVKALGEKLERPYSWVARRLVLLALPQAEEDPACL